jgi:small subunit ribosomal protein S10
MEIKTNTKIRIKLESFNHELLMSSCQKIIELLQKSSEQSNGIISLPTKTRIYCVLRSPHVNKDSREHFEIRSHKRMIEVFYTPDSSIIDLLSQIDLPSGIYSRICLL